jgi:hypothetical protein
MSVSIAHLVLAGGIALLAAGLAASGSRTRRWRIVCILLPAAAGVMALLAAGGLHVAVGGGAARDVVILLDASGSARTSPWRDPAWVRRLAERRLDPATRITVVAFGRELKALVEDVAAGDAGRWPSAWEHFGESDGGDLAGALAWRSPAEARGAPLAPRWIITDGLAQWPPDTSAAGVTLVAPQADVGVTDLSVREGALWAHVRAAGAVPAAPVEIFRDGKSLGSNTVMFENGGGGRWISVPVAEGPAVYEVRLEGRDPWPENDRGRLVHAAAGPARVLHVAAGERLPGDAWKLAAAGWQVVELEELAADDLATQDWQTLDTFVRQTGGGVVMVGARRAFGPGGYTGIAAALSPVANGPPDGPPVQVVLLLDASASMNEAAGTGGEQKFRLAARGVAGGVALLRPQDRIAVIAFNTTATLLADGTKAQLTPALDAALDAVRPAGGTLPDAALEAVDRGLSGDAPHKLLVLLTDGEVPQMDIAAWRSLLQRHAAKLAVVAPQSARTGPLAALVADGTWLNGDAPERWPALLRSTIAGINAGRTRGDTLRWHAVAGGELQATARAWTEVWTKPESQITATGEAVDGAWTIAATAQRGLGRVAAVALAPDAPGAPALIDKMIAGVMPSSGDRRFSVAAKRAGDGWEITADGTQQGRFLNDETLRVRIAGQTIAMAQTAPGRYVARVPTAAGAIVVREEQGAEKLVARPEAPEVGSAEWPASAVPLFVPGDAARISADLHDDSRWILRAPGRSMALATPLWIGAALCALAALWGRRVGGR